MLILMPKVAVIHEWLVDYSGSEWVLEQLLNVFPNADLFAVVDFRPVLMIMVPDQRRISSTMRTMGILPRVCTRICTELYPSAA